MRRTALLAVVLVCLGVANAQAGLVNADFETGSLSPWYVARNFAAAEPWNVTSAEAHSGVYSATDAGNAELRQDFAAIPVNQIVELSYWLKQPQSMIAAFDFFYSDSTGYEDVVSLSSSDWTFFDVTSRLTPGKELVGFSVWGYTSGGGTGDRTYLDDVTLRVTGAAVPAPGAIVLGAIGGGLVGWMRRRGTL